MWPNPSPKDHDFDKLESTFFEIAFFEVTIFSIFFYFNIFFSLYNYVKTWPPPPPELEPHPTHDDSNVVKLISTRLNDVAFTKFTFYSLIG